MQTTIFRTLLILTLLFLTSTAYSASVSLKWIGRVPFIDTPKNVTLTDDGAVTWEMNGKAYSKMIGEDFVSQLGLTVVQTERAMLIYHEL
ncbi:hypothetical protein [Vibrio parahaemolyticus]